MPRECTGFPGQETFICGHHSLRAENGLAATHKSAEPNGEAPRLSRESETGEIHWTWMLLRLILTSAGATALPNWHLDARPPWEAVLASWDRESNFSRPRPMLNPLVDSWDDVLPLFALYDRAIAGCSAQFPLQYLYRGFEGCDEDLGYNPTQTRDYCLPQYHDWAAREISGSDHVKRSECRARSGENVCLTGQKIGSSAATMAYALRLALGDEAFQHRTAPVVVHVVSFGRRKSGKGSDDWTSHRSYFESFSHYMRVLLPNARKVRLQLYGSEVRPHGHLSLLDGWFEVWAQPGMYDDHIGTQGTQGNQSRGASRRCA